MAMNKGWLVKHSYHIHKETELVMSY